MSHITVHLEIGIKNIANPVKKNQNNKNQNKNILKYCWKTHLFYNSSREM